MAWRIEWNPAAVVEAETEALRYARKREGLGDRFLDEIDTTIERIADGPEHFQRWPDDPSYRRAVLRVFPFVSSTGSTSRVGPSSSYPLRRRSGSLGTGSRSRPRGRDLLGLFATRD